MPLSGYLLTVMERLRTQSFDLHFIFIKEHLRTAASSASFSWAEVGFRLQAVGTWALAIPRRQSPSLLCICYSPSELGVWKLMNQIFANPFPPLYTAATSSFLVSLKQLFLTVEIFDNTTIFGLFCSSQGFIRKLFFFIPFLRHHTKIT